MSSLRGDTLAGFNTGYLVGDKCLSNEYINVPPRKGSVTVEVKKDLVTSLAGGRGGTR